MTEQERYERDKASVISMIRFILMALIIVAICFLATRIAMILIPFLIGFLLARAAYAIANPLVDLFTKNAKSRTKVLKAKRITASTFYYILLILITAGASYIIYLLIGQLANATNAIVAFASTFDPARIYNDLMEKVSSFNVDETFSSALMSILSALGTRIAGAVPGMLTSIVNSILGTIGNIPYGIFVAICVIFSGHYFINDTPHVLKLYNKIVPHRGFRVRTLHLFDTLTTTIFKALTGYVLLFVITSIEAYVFLYFAGVKYALILAIITGLIDFMPVLGISATMLPVIGYCFLHGDYKAVAILIIGMAFITLVRRAIEPPIIGKSLHLHPLLMLISMAAGVYIWGAVGFLLGPTVLIIIMEVLKVFEFDKKIVDYLTNFIGKFMPDSKKRRNKANKNFNPSAKEASKAKEAPKAKEASKAKEN